jgi:hypothetical protein
MAEKKNIIGFKKFSDIKSNKKLEEVNPSLDIKPSNELPMNPNIPKTSNKTERPISTKEIKPVVDDKTDEDMNESRVQTIGKIARFPKNIKASKAYNFLENVKVSKKSIWYIMVERDNELQMIKYNYKEGVDLNKFVNELKTYYIDKNKGNKSICESINKMSVDGNDKYSMIRNIPLIDIDGKKLITKVTEDLIKLLSK